MHPPPIMGLFMADGSVSPLQLGSPCTVLVGSLPFCSSPSQFCSVVVSVDGKEGTVIRLATSDMLKGTITAVLNAIFQTVSIEL